ncbi:MAG TPA: ABC transporter permease, partial [Bryobacteraceae bacterium]|nr:ABC transporter permease [Bryobacteraceae bacterium]
MTGFTQDLRYALRDLIKNPGFTLIAVLTLAIGIGANTAMFSVIRGVLLDPLPYPDAGRLYRIFYNSEQFPRFPVNPTDFMDFRERQRVFESFAVFTQSDRSLSDPARPERLAVLQVSKDYFHVLGAQPQMGSDFESSHEVRGNHQVAMLSDAFWKRRFDGDRSIVGRKILLDGEPFTVLGVMSPEFQHPGGTYRSPAHGATVDVWIPFVFARGNRGSHFLNAVARLAPGVDEKRATDELNRMMADLAKDFPGTNAGWRISLVSLREEIVGRSQRMLLVLLGAVGFVLLIACVNVAGLLLVRATARARDLAVQAALGAGRHRLIRQCLVEAGMLSLLGAAAGALLATWGVKVLARLISGTVPRADLIRIDPLL